MKTLTSSILKTLAVATLAIAPMANAAIYVKIPSLPGDVTAAGNSGWFVADSFSFGVEREMKESGEKGGTEDINIGVGELQECTISKSMDTASPLIAQLASANRDLVSSGHSLTPSELLGDDLILGDIEICVADEVSRSGEPVCYLKYKLERAFIKSWSTSGDADDRPTEEVAFYYNKIAFGY